eukprot:4233770-Pyramimonas_sp.AAC.1
MGSMSTQRSALTPQQSMAWPGRPPTKHWRPARRMGSRGTQRSALTHRQNMAWLERPPTKHWRLESRL